MLSRAAAGCWTRSRPGGIWRDSGRVWIDHLQAAAPQRQGTLECGVILRKLYTVHRQGESEIAQLERFGGREDQSFLSPIVVGNRREKCSEKRFSDCTYSRQTVIFFASAIFGVQFATFKAQSSGSFPSNKCLCKSLEVSPHAPTKQEPHA